MRRFTANSIRRLRGIRNLDQFSRALQGEATPAQIAAFEAGDYDDYNDAIHARLRQLRDEGVSNPATERAIEEVEA